MNFQDEDKAEHRASGNSEHQNNNYAEPDPPEYSAYEDHGPSPNSPDPYDGTSNRKITRRGFVTTAGAFTALTSASKYGLPLRGLNSLAPDTQAAPSSTALKLTVNGHAHAIAVDPRVTLLDLLRENLSLTGTKKGCDHGQCGACTVLVNGRRINSCLSLAIIHDNDQIVTVEGLSKGGQLHPVQAAFLEHDGFQCGYCTPGQICSAVALLEEHKRGDASFVTSRLDATTSPQLTGDEIRERMSGNICRCGAYPGIVAAIQTLTGGQGHEKERSGE